MSTDPQALMALMQQQEPPSTQLPPLASSLVAGPPPQPQPLPQTQQPQPLPRSAAADIDPQVLSRPVRIKIDGASRMLSKDILAQNIQFLYPLVMNGPFIQQLMQAGYAVDFLVLAKMMQDATGTAKAYPWVRPLNQQEEQRLQQPPAQVQAQMQQKQADNQTREKIMGMKLQGEQQKQQSQAELAHFKISEESARHLIEQIMNSGGPEAKMLETRMKMMQGQQQMQQQQQSHQMGLNQQQQSHQLDLAHQTQAHQLDMQQQQHQMINDAQRANFDNHVAQQQGHIKVHQIMTQARAQHASSQMKLQHQQAQQRLQQQQLHQKGKTNGRPTK